MIRSMSACHGRGQHRKIPRKKCPECQAERARQWQQPSPARRINETLEAKRAPQC